LHRLIPGSRLAEFADAGHAILHQCAARLNDVLLDHFARADATFPLDAASRARFTAD
jgi:pimeloyl-ACP methyl ester carboxylesterase